MSEFPLERINQLRVEVGMTRQQVQLIMKLRKWSHLRKPRMVSKTRHGATVNWYLPGWLVTFERPTKHKPYRVTNVTEIVGQFRL